MTAGIGHNGGPGVEPGASWRVHCWRKARSDLLPVLPIEVVRLRVARARELGLDYRTYAGIRASNGQDLVAFLFSTNALRLLRPVDQLPPDRQIRLAGQVDVARHIAVLPPLVPDHVRACLDLSGIRVDVTGHAPRLDDGWSVTRQRIRAMLAEARHPADRVLLVGDTALERGWAEAAALAGYLPAERFFGVSA
ncbi:MAG: hypothetical protein ACRCSU_08890 [Paracoccaceae bacterium]